MYNLTSNEYMIKFEKDVSDYFQKHKDNSNFDQHHFFVLKDECIIFINLLEHFINNEYFFTTWLSDIQNYHIEMVQKLLNIPINQINDILEKYHFFEKNDLSYKVYHDINTKIINIKIHFENILKLTNELKNYHDLENICNYYLRISNLIKKSFELIG